MRDASLILQWILERSQARIGLTRLLSIMTNETGKRAVSRSKHLDARVSPEEYEAVSKKAAACGLSLSEYTRKCALGHNPKLHLTEREREAYCSLADARGDIVHIRSALKGKTQEQIKSYFKNERFMRAWIDAITNLINQWDRIIEQLKE